MHLTERDAATMAAIGPSRRFDASADRAGIPRPCAVAVGRTVEVHSFGRVTVIDAVSLREVLGLRWLAAAASVVSWWYGVEWADAVRVLARGGGE